MEKIKKIDLNNIIGSEFPSYRPYLFFAGGIFVVVFLQLYTLDRMVIASIIMGVSLFLACSSYQRRKKVVKGVIAITKTQNEIIVESPLCDNGSRVQIGIAKRISVEVIKVNQVTTHGINPYYKVQINGESIFRSAKLKSAEFVKLNISQFIKTA